MTDNKKNKKLPTDRVKNSRVSKQTTKKSNNGDKHHATFNFVVPTSPNSSVSSSSSVSARSILGNKHAGIYFGHKTNEKTDKHTDFKGSANSVLSPRAVSHLAKKVEDGRLKATVSSLNIRSYHGKDKKNDTYTHQGRIVVKPTSGNSERKVDKLGNKLLHYQEQPSKGKK